MKKLGKKTFSLILFTVFMAIFMPTIVKAAEIEQFNVTIPELVSGQDLITNCSVDDDSYTARIVKWYKGGNQENPGTDLGLSGKYEAGNLYVAEVAFKPISENTISSNAKFNTIGAPDGYYVETNSDGEAIVRFELNPSYLVKFDTDGGTKIPDAVVKYNESLDEAKKVPVNPVKEGYTFMGWYPNTDFLAWESGDYIFHEIFQRDTTLYALFVPNDNIITAININVAPPIVGDEVTVKTVVDEQYGYSYEEVSVTPQITVLDKDAQYKLSETRWVVTGEDFFKIFEGTIKENTNYLADIMVYLPEGSEYRFSDSLTITANGEEPIEIGDISATYASFIVKVAATTEKTNPEVPEQEKPNASETEEVKPLEVKVEAVEDTTTDSSAVEAVEKLIKDIVDGKEVSGMNNELKEKISKALDEKKSISVEVTIPEVTEEIVKKDAEKVKEKLSVDEKIATYFDIDVVVKIDGASSGNVTELSDKITITVPVPTNLPKVEEGYTRQFTVIRVHDGIAEELETNVSGDKITFLSDKFSTYALAYKDSKNENAPTSSNTEKNTNSNNPKTGDNIIIFAIVFAIAGIGIITTAKFNKVCRIRKH